MKDLHFLKRMLLYLLLFLFLLSMYNDLHLGTPRPKETPTHHPHLATHSEDEFQIVQIKVQPGESALSIIEKINPNLSDQLNIMDVIADFKRINPGTNPHELHPQHSYFFPLY